MQKKYADFKLGVPDYVTVETEEWTSHFLAYAWDFSYYLREAMRVRALRGFMCLTGCHLQNLSERYRKC